MVCAGRVERYPIIMAEWRAGSNHVWIDPTRLELPVAGFKPQQLEFYRVFGMIDRLVDEKCLLAHAEGRFVTRRN